MRSYVIVVKSESICPFLCCLIILKATHFLKERSSLGSQRTKFSEDGRSDYRPYHVSSKPEQEHADQQPHQAALLFPPFLELLGCVAGIYTAYDNEKRQYEYQVVEQQQRYAFGKITR